MSVCGLKLICHFVKDIDGTQDEGLFKSIFGCQRDCIAPPRAQEFKLAKDRVKTIFQDVPRFLPRPFCEELGLKGFCGLPKTVPRYLKFSSFNIMHYLTALRPVESNPSNTSCEDHIYNAL